MYRYGINRQESQHAMMNDEELCFKELKEKFPEAAAAIPVPVPVTSTSPGSAPGPFQRRPGLKKPGPKKGVPRKKKPPLGGDPNKPSAAPPAAGVEGTTHQGSEEGKVGLDNGDTAPPQAAESQMRFGEGDDDERTKGNEVEGMEETTDGDAMAAMDSLMDSSELRIKEEELESRPDSADMSQDANSINDDLDEGLGSGDDDNEDEDERNNMDERSQAVTEQEIISPPYDSLDNMSKMSGIDEETSNLFAVKTESMDEDYEAKEQFTKMEVNYENLSDDNSNLGDGEQPMDVKPPLSMLQEFLLKGGDENHLAMVKQEGKGGGKVKPEGKNAKSSSTKKKDSVPKVVVPTFRWPKVKLKSHTSNLITVYVLNIKLDYGFVWLRYTV